MTDLRPEAAGGHIPPEGVPLAARQGRLRGGPRQAVVVAAFSAALLCVACGSKPPQPDWLVIADSAQDRFQRAWLAGRDRVAEAEFARLRSEVAATARPQLVARAELTRCAVQRASLVFDPCTAFEPLRADVPEAERAYADFLAGQVLSEAQAAQLPAAYRAIAAGRASGSAAVQAIDHPVSRLVASAVLLQSGRADPGVLQLAVDTASQQGWRRAVVAWLNAQALRAEQAGAGEEAARLRRRIQLATEGRPAP